MSPTPDFQTTKPTPLSLMSGREIDDFRVANPAEVLSLLRRLVDSAVLVQLSSPSGAAYTSTLWAVDASARRISLDADPAHPQVPALIDGGEATAVAYLDAIKLQFDLHGLMLVHGQRASALQAALPAVMYRFQRREFFRVRARDSSLAHVRHPACGILTLRVLDVSVGGCSLALPGDVPPIEPGTVIDGVRIELDADTLFVAALRVQHVTGGFASPTGRGNMRLGCSFAHVDGTSQRALQRYIDLTQRREKFLLLG